MICQPIISLEVQTMATTKKKSARRFAFGGREMDITFASVLPGDSYFTRVTEAGRLTRTLRWPALLFHS